MTEYLLSARELEEMRDDLVLDIEELQDTLDWVNEQLILAQERESQRGYVPAPIEKIRDAVRDHGKVTAADISRLLGISAGQAGYKLKQLYDQGTLMRTRTGGKMIYSLAKPQRGVLRTKHPSRPNLRLVGAIPGTGKKNPQVLRRRGHTKGVKGQ